MNIVPSIELIPAKYGVGTLLTQVPMDNSGDFSVSGATTPIADRATRVNSQGFIETVPDNVPRLDYLQPDGSIGCPALLVEPSAQNTCLQSETFQNWAYVNASASSGNAAISPRNTQTAGLFIPNFNSNGRAEVACGTLSNATTYSFSCFIKTPTNSLTSVWLYISDGGGGTGSNRWGVVVDLTNFTLTDFTMSNGIVISKSVENYGNGWYRIRVTGQVTSAMGGSSVAVIRKLFAGADTNGINGVLVWGAQLETGSVATSYIPTTTTAITRGADVINKTGVSGLIGQTEGTIYAEFEYKTNTEERRLITLSDGTTSNRVMIWTQSNVLYAQVEAGSILLANPITEGYHKVAFAYQQSGVSGTLFASLNGAAVVSGTSLAFPASLTDINIGKRETTASSTFFWNARIRAAAIYKTRLPNYLLESATSQIQSYSALASSLSYTVV